MASSLYRIINFLVFLLLVSCSAVVAFDGKLLSRTCNGHLFVKGSNYQSALTDTMNDLISHTPESPALDYYCWYTHRAEYWYEGDVTLYGHGVCTSSLLPDDCRYCIKYADSEMFKDCTHSTGAHIQLMDCRLRYENYKFNNDG